MSRRVALASADGQNVDLHFGHASTFLIVDLGENDWTAVELRETERFCQGREHTAGQFDAVLAALEDCEAVFAAKIGPGAVNYLIRHGKKVCQATGPVADILEETIRERVLDDEVPEQQAEVDPPKEGGRSV